ncbi:GNAT family N-acetyltransferase [Streptobacillus moniliformis]|uniref:GNAT family N-acetyltransferase n=1 Tax=Streptobacillus moniliformis TaxID=34105 RepID=UPI0007E39DA5|nr:GNAT family N-acetyltransferase [Streptobacillus moniliformis]
MDNIIKFNVLNVEDYLNLHEKCGFKEYEKEDVTIAIKNHLFDAVLFFEEKVVGMIRVVGENKIVFFIKDLMILPEYRNKGYGKLLLNSALEYISKNACKGAYIGLMSTVDYETFYEKFGFIRRPNENFGSGMVKFNE